MFVIIKIIVFTYIKMEYDYKKVNIQIVTFGVNSSDIEGLAEFKEELDSIYNLECKDEECAACGCSSELEILISLGTLVADSAVSGVVWDLTRGILSKFWNSLKKLGATNENLTLYVTIELGGYVLRINEAMYKSYGTLEALFHIIEERILYLDSKGFSDIKSITMPFVETNDKANRFTPKEPYTDFEDYWWMVEYQNGNNQLYFNPNTLEIFIQS